MKSKSTFVSTAKGEAYNLQSYNLEKTDLLSLYSLLAKLNLKGAVSGTPLFLFTSGDN